MRNKVSFSGIGVHSGDFVNLSIFPSDEKTGIVFRRKDISDRDNVIRLTPDSVIDPTLCTRLVNRDKVSVSVVEHLLAALRISGITNALIELDSEEVPILDGSALVFMKAFKQVGIRRQGAYVAGILVKRPVVVESKNGRIEILPNGTSDVSLVLDYDRINPVIKENNSYSFNLLGGNLDDIASARTFGWFEDYEKVLAMGLARGTSEVNTVVIMPDNSIKNKEGLRNPKELVLHKCLDLIGDISVIGCDIIGEIRAINPSHSLNNLLMRKLLSELPEHEILEAGYVVDESPSDIRYGFV